MNVALTALGALTLSSTVALAGGSNGPYDDHGDPLNPPPPLAALPGDVWNSWSHGFSTTNGVAPYQGDLLVSVGFSTTIQHISEFGGSVIGSFPVADGADAWLGYDESRDLMITVNPSLDVMRGYTPGNAVPVFETSTPTTGPVGLAWDSSRDEYAYVDWETDQIVVYDANTLAVVRSFVLPLTRMAGVAYDCTDDTYVVGDRDTSAHYAVNPDTGAIGFSYTTAGIGISIPRGAALSRDGGIWTGDFGSGSMYLQEAGHGPVIGCGGPGTSFCFGDGSAGVCPCGNNGSASSGCRNSSGSGATLTAFGSADVAADDLVLTGAQLPVGVPSLYFAGTTALTSGVILADGLRCAGGPIQRLGVAIVDSGGSAISPAGIASSLGATPGSTSVLQLWYRDLPGPCGGGSNLTNAIEIVWQ